MWLEPELMAKALRGIPIEAKDLQECRHGWRDVIEEVVRADDGKKFQAFYDGAAMAGQEKEGEILESVWKAGYRLDARQYKNQTRQAIDESSGWSEQHS